MSMIYLDEVFPADGRIICPKCGNNNIYIKNMFGEGYNYHCFCPKCELEQDLYYSCARKAVEAWNRGEIQI